MLYALRDKVKVTPLGRGIHNLLLFPDTSDFGRKGAGLPFKQSPLAPSPLNLGYSLGTSLPFLVVAILAHVTPGEGPWACLEN